MWHAFTAPSLGYVPSMFAFVPALSRVPCKYHRIQHHLQRLRLHQPAFPPIHNHPTHSHRGGAGNHDHPRGGGVGVPRAVPYIAHYGPIPANLGATSLLYEVAVADLRLVQVRHGL